MTTKEKASAYEQAKALGLFSARSVDETGELPNTLERRTVMESLSNASTQVNSSDKIKPSHESASTKTATMAGWWAALIGPGDDFELRSIKKGGGAEFRHYRNVDGQLDQAVSAALKSSHDCEGIYITLNPLKAAPSIEGRAAKDADVRCRRWLLIDFDPERQVSHGSRKLSSTAEEKASAEASLKLVKDELTRQGWPEPVVADSGNGYHLLYRVNLAADDGGLVKRVLHGLAKQFDTKAVKVDRSVCNASRICKFYGTTSRKGPNTVERPHRASAIIAIPSQLEIVTREMLESIAASEDPDRAMRERRGAVAVQPVETAIPEEESRASIEKGHGRKRGLVAKAKRTDPLSRAEAFMKAADPAIEGEEGTGSNHTLRIISNGCYAFGLTEEQAYQVASVHWNPRCQPPWEEHGSQGLRRKIAEAYRTCKKRFGWKLNESQAEAKAEKRLTEVTAGATPKNFHATDMGNGERLVSQHGDSIRFCYPWKRWLAWDSSRWAEDNKARVAGLAKQTVRSIYMEAAAAEDKATRAELSDWAVESESRPRLDAMISMASKEAGIPILPDEMDQDPWLFNVQNGTIDLRTGERRPHRRSDLITKLAPVEYDPDARCELWESTLETFLPDQDVRDYLQRFAGYCLTGVVRDQEFPIAYGSGSNGKSTVLNTLLALWGPDYAMKATPDLLMARKQDGHPTDKADLFGKRLVLTIETEDGRRLNETVVKELTGGDRIRARRMREDFWEFAPTHKLVLATNHKPAVRGTDHAIWRRLCLVPFDQTMPKGQAVKDMPERLVAEFPGILAWAVRGCLEWQRQGLNPPASILNATAEYRSDEDILGRFVAEKCEVNPHARVKAGVLYGEYKAWAEASGLTAISLVKFGKSIVERGFRKEGTSQIWYCGLRVNEDDPGHSGHLGGISGMNEPSLSASSVIPENCPNSPKCPDGSSAGIPAKPNHRVELMTWLKDRLETIQHFSVHESIKEAVRLRLLAVGSDEKAIVGPLFETAESLGYHSGERPATSGLKARSGNGKVWLAKTAVSTGEAF